MATFDISEENNAVQITMDGNFDQVQKGYYQIEDPTNDQILYIIRDGNNKYRINTSTDTITVNGAPFVGNSNDLKDAINPFFFKASSGGGGGAVDSVFGRTGDVIAQSGDYDVSQVTNAFDSTGDTMSGNIDMGTNNIINGGSVAITGSYTGTDYNGVPLTNLGSGDNYLSDDGTYKAVSVARTQIMQFGLAEEIQNADAPFASGFQVDVNQNILSWNQSGLQNSGAANPTKVAFNGNITEALVTVKGVGVQNGSVTYPVLLNVDVDDMQFFNAVNIDTISFQIPSDVGTFSVGNTNFQGSETLSIGVTKGQELSARFRFGNGASQAAQVRNVFITLIITES